MSENRLEYAIIGGGISGLTLALALQYRGVSARIYERAAQFGEIGAGVSLSPNALKAMKVCHPGIYEAFERICSKNIWSSKQKVWFDYYDGQHQGGALSAAFTITNELGQRGVHRALFLDELVKLLSPENSSFGKSLQRYEQDSDGLYTLFFEDGSTAQANAIIGCDGIKSTVRRLIFGSEHKCASPSFTHKYAYRALVSMEDAVFAIGSEKAENSCMHMGQGGHVLTFPVNGGKTVNVVAFHTTSKGWPDSAKLTAPATRDDALRDFASFGETVTSLLKLAKPQLDIWAIFDLGDHPPPTFNAGGVVLVGDAAHAPSPHHGAGAGFCIEDSAILSELLASDQVVTNEDIERAFSVFNTVRRPRTSWLVQSSRHIGDAYEWLAPELGDDFTKIEADINHRNSIIADVDVSEMCEHAKAELLKACLQAEM